MLTRIGRVAAAHGRTTGAAAAGVAAYVALLPLVAEPMRSVLAWDVFALAFLLLIGLLMAQSAPAQMGANARAQEEGEWTIFVVVLVATVVSFAAIAGVLSHTKDMAPAAKGRHVAVVVATIGLCWLVTQTIFALRYAHEFYTATNGKTADQGLEFPSCPDPDYWDFFYFSAVLGMTFQVSDVQVTSRKLRRLATAHGILAFVFNTVIVALTVNLAANLL